ncbi:YbaK/EbsC protein [Peptoniphilus duerdenii ATCC BAA-1640]|uniref:Cys-tRNA(Pro)/Cys-tRNA(Cys) deacylase n=1 Tax=Peptoniphilus duerdenii ATCC BAA-1640 TaxID=862517 RepID=E0NNM8_9FIRM|nr:Cys-tRNA(Pro) deacylase [Peptoniphilus duerdenii]EFM24631.1 YbaK/EbsC protein [Peptoniphilus duerdenii ATCC BAA-1640]
MKKTNVMRILDSHKINYRSSSYEPDEALSGVDAAEKLGVDTKMVYKTLVTESGDLNFVFVIPSDDNLDLKKAAKACGVKKIEMLKAKNLLPLTGYIHGGCSPVGMKKLFPTFIHKDAENLEEFYVSAGHIGEQIIINPKDLASLVNAKFCDLIKE